MVIKGYKGRELKLGDKVRVYRNLNVGCWSVLAMSGQYKGKVVAHLDSVSIREVEFIVSTAGRARVLERKVKSVHAYAQGIYVSTDVTPMPSSCLVVTYDPYKYGYFYKVDNESCELTEVQELNFGSGKAYMTQELAA